MAENSSSISVKLDLVARARIKESCMTINRQLDLLNGDVKVDHKWVEEKMKACRSRNVFKYCGTPSCGSLSVTHELCKLARDAGLGQEESCRIFSAELTELMTGVSAHLAACGERMQRNMLGYLSNFDRGSQQDGDHAVFHLTNLDDVKGSSVHGTNWSPTPQVPVQFLESDAVSPHNAGKTCHEQLQKFCNSRFQAPWGNLDTPSPETRKFHRSSGNLFDSFSSPGQLKFPLGNQEVKPALTETEHLQRGSLPVHGDSTTVNRNTPTDKPLEKNVVELELKAVSEEGRPVSECILDSTSKTSLSIIQCRPSPCSSEDGSSSGYQTCSQQWEVSKMSRPASCHDSVEESGDDSADLKGSLLSMGESNSLTDTSFLPLNISCSTIVPSVSSSELSCSSVDAAGNYCHHSFLHQGCCCGQNITATHSCSQKQRPQPHSFHSKPPHGPEEMLLDTLEETIAEKCVGGENLLEKKHNIGSVDGRAIHFIGAHTLQRDTDREHLPILTAMRGEQRQGKPGYLCNGRGKVLLDLLASVPSRWRKS